MHLAIPTHKKTTQAAIEALLEAYQDLDALADSERSIDRATHAKAVELLHRIEDTISRQSPGNNRIDLSASSTSINHHAWIHRAALDLLRPWVDRLVQLGFKVTIDVVH